ncbi:MAG: hypothetical protein U9Q18_01870 [Caldisericota bacterium]|nr:hypothetical protein [Caldisericota bacterium]
MKKYRFLTFVFDVPVVALFSLYIIYQFNKGGANSLRGFTISAIFIGIIPLLAWTHLLKHPGDYNGERKISFILDALSYPIGFTLLVITKSNKIFIALGLSYLLNVIFLFAVNKFAYKVSGHSSGIAGPATALTIITDKGMLAFLLLIPVYISKRKLGDHTFMQLAVGGITSILITCISFAVVGVL